MIYTGKNGFLVSMSKKRPPDFSTRRKFSLDEIRELNFTHSFQVFSIKFKYGKCDNSSTMRNAGIIVRNEVLHNPRIVCSVFTVRMAEHEFSNSVE